MRCPLCGSDWELRSGWYVDGEDLSRPRTMFIHALFQAQDLGLHRAEAVKQNIETRRRLWGACLISDRWYLSNLSMIPVQLHG